MVKARVRLGSQVTAFIAKLAPEPKRSLREALKGIAEGKSDTKLLEGNLAGFHRLRSGRIRGRGGRPCRQDSFAESGRRGLFELPRNDPRMHAAAWRGARPANG